MKRVDVLTEGWDSYTLLDSGEGRKLERFGLVMLDRPDPQALWQKENPTLWNKIDAIFSWAEKGERWKERTPLPNSWEIPYKEIIFSLSLKQLKHVGLFPEHEPQWREIATLCKVEKKIRVLNLFGYTGAASLIAASKGAEVTHVDASRQAIAIVKKNIELSNLPSNSIRIICEDAMKYVKRLVQRKEQFEVIIMDPPAFGRGPKGEIWKIEEKLQEFLHYIPALLSADAKLVLLNGYAAGYAARSFAEILSDILKDRRGEIVYGDIAIAQKNSKRVLPTGIYSKWQA